MKSPMYEYSQTMPAYKPYNPTGFIPNTIASFGMQIDENMSFSRFINEGDIRENKNKVYDLVKSGKMSHKEVDMFAKDGAWGTDIDWDRLISYANNKLDMNLPLNSTIWENTREELKGKREARLAIMQDANKMGITGQFVGGFAAAAIDPVAFPSYFVGFGTAAKGASMIARLAKGAAIGGVVEGATEAAIQPFVRSWKNDIGVDYSTKDAVENIMFATGAGATIGGFVTGVAAFLRRSKAIINTNVYAKHAAEELEAMVSYARGADPNADVAEVLERVTRKVQDIETPRVDELAPIEATFIEPDMDQIGDIDVALNMKVDEASVPLLDQNKIQVAEEVKPLKEMYKDIETKENVLKDIAAKCLV